MLNRVFVSWEFNYIRDAREGILGELTAALGHDYVAGAPVELRI